MGSARVMECSGVAVGSLSATGVLHLTQFPVSFFQSHLCVCKARATIRFFYDTCNIWYMIHGPWVNVIRCSLVHSGRLPCLPFDWGKLIYAVANQNPGMTQHALSPNRAPQLCREPSSSGTNIARQSTFCFMR